jgi:hypothetical protein
LLTKRKFADFIQPLVDTYSPQKPKLNQKEAHAMSQFVVLGMHNNRKLPEEYKEAMEANRVAQLNLESLQKWKMLEFVESLVKVDSAEQLFAAIGTASPVTGLSEQEAEFCRVIKLTMMDFSSVGASKSTHNYNNNHEQSFWVEQAVPMFKYLGRITGLVKFGW